jgi:hypothetical protein
MVLFPFSFGFVFTVREGPITATVSTVNGLARCAYLFGYQGTLRLCIYGSISKDENPVKNVLGNYVTFAKVIGEGPFVVMLEA